MRENIYTDTDELLHGLMSVKSSLEEIHNVFHRFDNLENSKLLHVFTPRIQYIEFDDREKKIFMIPFYIMFFSVLSTLLGLQESLFISGSLAFHFFVINIFNFIFFALGIYLMVNPKILMKVSEFYTFNGFEDPGRLLGCLSIIFRLCKFLLYPFIIVFPFYLPLASLRRLTLSFFYREYYMNRWSKPPQMVGLPESGYIADVIRDWQDVLMNIVPYSIPVFIVGLLIYKFFLTRFYPFLINMKISKANEAIKLNDQVENYRRREHNLKIIAQQKALLDKARVLIDDIGYNEGDWYPMDYLSLHECECFIKIIKNYEASTIREMIEVFNVDEYRRQSISNNLSIEEGSDKVNVREALYTRLSSLG